MPVILESARLVYLPIPKVACTSIKEMLHHAAHGQRFVPFSRPNGTRVFIHTLYPAVPFEQLDRAALAEFHSIAVVRDPVRRVLSAYGNRVVFHKDLHSPKIAARLEPAGLPPDPDLATFADRLEEYCAVAPKIAHHVRPQVDFLGKDPAFLSRIYRFSELETLAEDVRRLTGTQVTLPWSQRGGPKFQPSDLSPARQERLRTLFAQDYQHFGPWFD